MPKCRRESYCKYGMAENEEGEKDYDNKDPRRCFRCLATNYGQFEPYEDDEDSQEEE